MRRLLRSILILAMPACVFIASSAGALAHEREELQYQWTELAYRKELLLQMRFMVFVLLAIVAVRVSLKLIGRRCEA